MFQTTNKVTHHSFSEMLSFYLLGGASLIIQRGELEHHRSKSLPNHQQEAIHQPFSSSFHNMNHPATLVNIDHSPTLTNINQH